MLDCRSALLRLTLAGGGARPRPTVEAAAEAAAPPTCRLIPPRADAVATIAPIVVVHVQRAGILVRATLLFHAAARRLVMALGQLPTLVPAAAVVR